MNETSSKGKKWTDAEAVARVVEYEQTMIDAVRATGCNNAKRTLIVQGLGTSIAETNDHMIALPTDAAEDRLMVEVHFYEPFQFALMEEDASWGMC
ncbi:cellulase family glycosylhydrolase, partial [Klebsiella pneumoniae]|uniref:cellulase family glycosylhydrolase n=1 Tax=Klebsiella pneumoniae TaxID=573 RepID=UPI0025A2A013